MRVVSICVSGWSLKAMCTLSTAAADWRAAAVLMGVAHRMSLSKGRYQGECSAVGAFPGKGTAAMPTEQLGPHARKVGSLCRCCCQAFR